ncbi:MAG: hypothetical protein IPF68_15030 [Bacteroidales bacterium]|nr:hypothetical protein [Bacteroidales bacterium]
MNLTNVKAEKQRVEVLDGLQFDIQTYGLRNDYPQRVKTVTNASVTAKGCISTYQKFIQGKGFADTVFYKSVINNRGLTCDQCLSLVTHDISDYGGFSLHFNYNVFGQITDVTHIPFEHCRLGLDDDSGKVTKIAIHRDWTKLRRRTVISKSTIEYIDVFNPIPTVIQAQIEAAGGIDRYKGQVLYYSLDGDMVYPKPIYDAAITDISTEAGISNVLYRNARMNFMPAGMLIRKVSETSSAKTDENGRPVVDTFSKDFKQFQGDENACKIIDVEAGFDESAPEFVPFTTEKHADEMKTTSEMVQVKIGKPFLQPPILRAENVSTGFTLQAMQDAYTYYNSITVSERQEIERVFARIFANFVNPVNPSGNYSIIPLTYGQPDNGN